MRVRVLRRVGPGLEIAQVCSKFLIGQRGEQNAAHRCAIGRQAAADGEPGGENTAGGGPGDVHDLTAVEHAHRGRLVQFLGDLFEDGLGGFHHG